MHQLLYNVKLSTTKSRLITGGSQIFRRIATAVESPGKRGELNKHDLYSELSSVWSTGKKVPDILNSYWKYGCNNLGINDLVHCIKKFRQFRRFHHCLEILEWMEKSKIEHSEYALHLNILCKAKGISEAEKYFDSLPSHVKKGSLYGALFNGYCSQKMTDKALALFEKMDELNYASNDMAFSNLMCLYLKIDQPEKVPPLVEEMKRRNIPLSSVSYQTWMQSCLIVDDLEGVERVTDEIRNQKSMKNNWKIYCNIASAYIKAGQNEKAVLSLKEVEKILDESSYPDRIGYHYLISLYSSVGDLESVTRAWGRLKSNFKACNNIDYLSMLNALSKLENIEHLKKYFEEWHSKYTSYDLRLPSIVIGAYLRHDMLDDAELLLKEASDRTAQKVWKAHVLFMNYFLGKHQIDSALRHLKVAMANQWTPLAEKLDPFFEYFTAEKDVDGAEQFFQIIKKDQSLILTAYLRLLQTYAAAGKTAPEMRERMEQDRANTGTEHEELLEKVCPSWPN